MNELVILERRRNRIIKIEDGVAHIDVSTRQYANMITQIDEDDIPLILDGRTKWCVIKAKRTFYVLRNVGGRKNREFQLLHRCVLGLTDSSKHGDHRNGDGLDNRRTNLRVASNQQNSRNGRAHRDSTSQYRGVSWDALRRKWTAGIGINGKRHGLGRFATEDEAARAYDAAAAAAFGEFARPNFGK